MAALTSFPTDGSVWIDVLEDSVVLYLDPLEFDTIAKDADGVVTSGENGLAGLTLATIKSITLSATANGVSKTRAFKLAECKTLVDGVSTLVTQYSLEKLEVEQYAVSAQICFGSTVVTFGDKFTLSGTAPRPVIQSIAPKPSGNNEGVQLVVTPHNYSGDNKLQTDAITNVIFTVTDNEENAYEFNLAHDDAGIYDLSLAAFALGTEYFFTCATLTANGLSESSDSVAFTIVDTVDPQSGKLSLELSNDVDVLVKVAAQEYTLLTGLPAGVADDRKALNLLVRHGFADRALIAQDVDTIQYAIKSYPLRKSADGSKMIIDAFNFVVSGAAGKEMHASYAIQSKVGTSAWTSDVPLEIDPVLTAPTLTAVKSADGSYALTANVSQSPAGAILLGYQLETLNANGVLEDLGEWSVDAKNEIIIEGAVGASSITLSAFAGIVGQGVGKVPQVGIKPAAIVYTHGGASSPYFRVRVTAVYGQLDDFSFGDFVKQGLRYARSDLALNDSKLKVAGKELIAVSAFVDSAQVVSDMLNAPVTLAAPTSPDLVTDDKEGVVTATHTVTPIAGVKTFAESNKANVRFVLKNIKNGAESSYVYSEQEQNYQIQWLLEHGLHEYAYGVEVLVGTTLIGKSPLTSITGLPQISGPNRAQHRGKYAARSAAISSADDVVMTKVVDVVALAIETSGKISEDLDMPNLIDGSYTMNFDVTDMEEYDQIKQKWAPTNDLTVTKAAATRSYAEDDAEKGWDKKKKYAAIMIAGASPLVQYRGRVRRNFTHATNNFDDLVGDEGHVYFVRTSEFTAPAVVVGGEEQKVIVEFSQPAANALTLEQKEIIAVLSRGGIANDVYVNGSKNPVLTGNDSVLTVAATGASARVQGAQSYANPNRFLVQNKLESVDPARVSSAKSAEGVVNIEKGPDAATDVEFSTVRVSGADKMRIVRAKANESSVYYFVSITSDDSSVANLDKHYTVKPTWTATTEDANVMEAFIENSTIQSGLGLDAKKFMEAKLLAKVIASNASTLAATSRQTSSAVQLHIPNCVPTLAASDFNIDILPNSFVVTIAKLSAQQMGGFQSLQAQIIATGSMIYGNQTTDVQTLTKNGLVKNFGPMLAGEYTLSCLITGGDENYPVSKPIALGKRILGTAMQAAKNYKVYRAASGLNGPVSTVLTASWENETLRGDYAKESQTIYVKTKDAAGNDQWIVDTPPSQAVLDALAEGEAIPLSTRSTASVETAFGTVSNSNLSLSIDRLEVGKEYTVELQTVYKKSSYADIVARVSDYDRPSAEPSFTHLAWDETNAVLTAVFKDGGAAIQEILLLAYYDASKPAGEVFMKINMAPLSSVDANPNAEVRMLAVPADKSKPIPDGLMVILRNANGVDIRVSPTGTYGSSATMTGSHAASEIAAMPKFKTTFA